MTLVLALLLVVPGAVAETEGEGSEGLREGQARVEAAGAGDCEVVQDDDGTLTVHPECIE